MSLGRYLIHNPPATAQTEREIGWEFERWGVGDDFAIDYNVQRARLRNTTLSSQERAVTVRWIPPGATAEIVISSDDQETIAANLRKLFLGIQAMRLNERRGLAEVMRSAYLQLAAPAEDDPYAILGVEREATVVEVTRAYRDAARRAHPDRGGTDAAMAAVNAAYESIRRARGWAS